MDKNSQIKSPIVPFIENNGVMILDGGLATELEKRGYDLNHKLWSAKILINDPQAIRDVHLDYLRAGADCVVSASYQATIQGFMEYGMSESKAKSLILRSVDLAFEAREIYLNDIHPTTKRIKPLIAASIGPYGAFLADGSEYRGNYAVSNQELMDFHAPRWELLANSPADLLACETIPSYGEAEVLLNLLKRSPEKFAWFSFSCIDGKHISDGTPISKCALLLANENQAVALGINCTDPSYISSLIMEIKKNAPQKPVVVYPNSGEKYNASSKSWEGSTRLSDLSREARIWKNKGALLIGGCCRTGPGYIREICSVLRD